MQTPVNRRTVLKAAGTALALPFLESLLPAATAVRPPLRFGIFTVTGGTVLESWLPRQAGPLEKLPSVLRPLQPHTKDLLLVSGLCHAGRGENVNGHEHCAFTHLTGAPLVKKEGGKLYATISIDQAVAQAIGHGSILPSLEVGYTSHETRYSFRRADAPLPYEMDPRLVFDRMFRGRKPVVPNWAVRSTATHPSPPDAIGKSDSPEQGILDLVQEQTRDLRRKLGRDDRQKLDGYLESVRSVEKRLEQIETRQRLELLEASNPGPSRLQTATGLPAAGVSFWQAFPVDRDPERHADYIRLLADLMVLAFQTDTTRVMTVAAGSDEALFPGVVTVGYERHCHTLEHQGNAGRVEDADPIAREACRQIHTWYTGLFAEMVTKMKAIDEGGSSLLDNCLLLYTSYMADGGHGHDDYPMLLAGSAGNRLRTGRHLAFPKKAPAANLFVEILNLFGVPTQTFGDSHISRFAGSLDGRLPGLI